MLLACKERRRENLQDSKPEPLPYVGSVCLTIIMSTSRQARSKSTNDVGFRVREQNGPVDVLFLNKSIAD